MKLNERLYKFTTRCVRCAECALGYGDIEFEEVCPIYQRHKFFTYSLGGMAQLARAVHEGRLGIGESLVEVVYRCTGCGACGEMCAEVDFRDIVELQHEVRAGCVEVGQIPLPLMLVIEGLKKEDNMLQRPKAEWGKWAEGLRVKDITKEGAEVYFHAGCRYSFDEELWPVVRGAVKLLEGAGVEVGIAGKEETCCGGRAYEMGYQGGADQVCGEQRRASADGRGEGVGDLLC